MQNQPVPNQTNQIFIDKKNIKLTTQQLNNKISQFKPLKKKNKFTEYLDPKQKKNITEQRNGTIQISSTKYPF